MSNLMSKFSETAEKFQFVPQLLARIVIGLIFILASLEKFQSMPAKIQFFAQIGVPAPHFMTPLTAVFEGVGGLLILLGIGTRIATIPLIVIMFVAIKTVHLPEFKDIFSSLAQPNVHYILLLLWLLCAGPGKISLSTIFCKKKD